jgi:hypothetical protein
MADQAKHYSLGPSEGKALFVLGDVITLKLSAAETNSAYSLVEVTSVPGVVLPFCIPKVRRRLSGFSKATTRFMGGMKTGRNM